MSTSKIDLKKLRSGGRHTVTVNLQFEENGNKMTEQMRVVYRGVSLRDGAQIEDRYAKMEDKREALIEALVANVVELPDVQDNGQPVQPTAEFFGTLDTYYLNRINQAIQDDRAGN
jgi:hypothetical protein